MISKQNLIPNKQSLSLHNKPENIRITKLKKWIEVHYLQLALFNGFLILLVLLRSAGYFEPYFPITINSIVIVSVILSIFLFGLSSRTAALLAIFFWILAALFKILKIEVWADRASLYSYEVLVISILITSCNYLASSLSKFKKE